MEGENLREICSRYDHVHLTGSTGEGDSGPRTVSSSDDGEGDNKNPYIYTLFHCREGEHVASLSPTRTRSVSQE